MTDIADVTVGSVWRANSGLLMRSRLVKGYGSDHYEHMRLDKGTLVMVHGIEVTTFPVIGHDCVRIDYLVVDQSRIGWILDEMNLIMHRANFDKVLA